MPEFIEAAQPYLTALKDLVTIISIVVGGFVAVRGLEAWRRQLTGTTEYELARRVIKAVYALRDALERVRSPLITSAEMANALQETGTEVEPSADNARAATNNAVYQVRWRPVVEAYQALELEALEAEALWGRELRDLILQLKANVNSLLSALDLILRHQAYPDTNILDHATHEVFSRIIYRQSNDPAQDKYSQELNQQVASIEERVRPHLRQ